MNQNSTNHVLQKLAELDDKISLMSSAELKELVRKSQTPTEKELKKYCNDEFNEWYHKQWPRHKYFIDRMIPEAREEYTLRVAFFANQDKDKRIELFHAENYIRKLLVLIEEMDCDYKGHIEICDFYKNKNECNCGVFDWLGKKESLRNEVKSFLRRNYERI